MSDPDDGQHPARRASFHFDRHTPQYRDRFEEITSDMHQRCPLGWTDTYGGHWVAAGNKEVFELARCLHISSDNGVIQGMQHLPATFTPGPRLGPGLDATLDKLQRICDEKELAAPITVRKAAAVID